MVVFTTEVTVPPFVPSVLVVVVVVEDGPLVLEVDVLDINVEPFKGVLVTVVAALDFVAAALAFN